MIVANLLIKVICPVKSFLFGSFIYIDVTGTIPKPGAGGEYDVQDGFGWTNGVVLDLLTTYYDRMTIGDIGQNVTHGPSVRPCRSKTYRIRYRLVPLLCTTVFYFLRL
ncbi:trehalase, putative [Brugia malayi]|uniref:Trehalase n=2 Tax=Brugia TaxID=6278 RepID=A0A0K0J1Q2_BRUMA|nr:trehalase, putative [Brugia malayi]CDQ04281.1 Bm14782 [Brugia malayi]VDO43645.1 unnamed protein product [Brugia timori]VIO92477.1 trehalase, putative [Brugia malayi]